MVLNRLIVAMILVLVGSLARAQSIPMAFDVPAFLELNDKAAVLEEQLKKEFPSKDDLFRFLRTKGFQDTRLIELQARVGEFVKSSPLSLKDVQNEQFQKYYFSSLNKPVSGLLRFMFVNVAIFNNWWTYREVTTWRDFGKFNVWEAQTLAMCFLREGPEACEVRYSRRGLVSVQRFMTAIIIPYLTASPLINSLKNQEEKRRLEKNTKIDLCKGSLDRRYEYSILYHLTVLANLNSSMSRYAGLARNTVDASQDYDCFYDLETNRLDYNDFAKIASKYVVDFESL